MLKSSFVTSLFPWLKKARRSWKTDVIAGLSVAVVSIPQALAYASVAGMPPFVGLLALGIPTIIAALVTSSTILVTGPVAIVSLLTAVHLQSLNLANPEGFFAIVAAMTILVGLIQLFFKLLNLGSLISYVANPVVMGFTTAAAGIIALSQLPTLLGIQLERQPHFYLDVVELARHLNAIHLPTATMGVGCLLGLIVIRKIPKSFPSVLIVIIAALVSGRLATYTGEVVGVISPQLTLNTDIAAMAQVVVDNFSTVWLGAVIIAVVGYMGGISVAKAYSLQTHDVIKPNRELLAQGLANLASGLIGAYPVAGSVSQTALNQATGAKSNLAAITIGIAALVSSFLLTPMLRYLPKATLAAIIIMAVSKLINVRGIIDLLKRRHREGTVAIITAVSTIAFSPRLDLAIIIGVIASGLAHAHRSLHPPMEIFFCDDREHIDANQYHIIKYATNHQVLAVIMDWSLTFINAAHFQERVLHYLETSKRKPAYILMMCQGINHIDDSAEEMLRELHEILQSKRIKLMFSGIKPHTMHILNRNHMLDFIGEGNVYHRVNEALRSVGKKTVS